MERNLFAKWRIAGKGLSPSCCPPRGMQYKQNYKQEQKEHLLTIL